MYDRRNPFIIVFEILVAVLLVLLLLDLLTGCSSSTTSTTPPPATTSAAQPKAVPTQTHAKHHKIQVTRGQKQATKRAELYLSAAGWSKQGLEDQLLFDQFSKADAKYAVNHLDVDWKAQAVKKAKEYLNITGFSEKGLVDQLEFDKFTHAQAVYGAHEAFKE